MIRTIVEKELRDMIGSTRFAVSFAVSAILIILTFYAGARSYHVDRARTEAATAENLRKMEGLTDWLRVNNHRVFLPPKPLEALVTGVSNDIGRTMAIRGRGELAAHDSRYNDDPIFAVFRFLDLEFIFQVVLSLFAVVFAYDAINGEKERGTLRLTFANAVPRGQYIVGKLVGSVVALAVPLIVPMLIGCLVLVLAGVPMSSEDGIRLALVILAGFLYFTAFVSLSVLMSTLTRRSSSSFVFMLVIWIVAVFIIPRASVLLAGRAVKVPSVDELAYQKGKLGAQLHKEGMEKLAGFRPSNNDDPEKMVHELNTFMEDNARERDKKMDALAQRLNEERRNRQAVQERLAFGFARLSPGAAFTLAAQSLAGTSIDLKSRFVENARAYQEPYGQFMLGKTGMNPGGRFIIMRMKRGDGEEDQEKPINPRELPPFEYTPEPLGDAVSAALPDMGLLALFNLLFFAGAFVAFLRYDVR